MRFQTAANPIEVICQLRASKPWVSWSFLDYDQVHRVIRVPVDEASTRNFLSMCLSLSRSENVRHEHSRSEQAFQKVDSLKVLPIFRKLSLSARSGYREVETSRTPRRYEMTIAIGRRLDQQKTIEKSVAIQVLASLHLLPPTFGSRGWRRGQRLFQAACTWQTRSDSMASVVVW